MSSTSLAKRSVLEETWKVNKTRRTKTAKSGKAKAFVSTSDKCTEWEAGDLKEALFYPLTSRPAIYESYGSQVVMVAFKQPTLHRRSQDTLKLVEALRAADRLLEYADDWDGEGSPGYSVEIVATAKKFLSRSFEHLWEHYDICPEPPSVEPGPAGSIDLHWENSARELLINIPIGSTLAGFYGDNRGEEKIKGKLDLNRTNEWILLWLMQ